MCSEVHRPPSDPQCTALLELQIAAEVEHGGDQAWSQSIMHWTLLRSLLDVMDVVMLCHHVSLPSGFTFCQGILEDRESSIDRMLHISPLFRLLLYTHEYLPSSQVLTKLKRMRKVCKLDTAIGCK